MTKKDTTSKKQNKKVKPTEDLIEVSKTGDGNVIAAGRNAKASSVVINFFGGKWQLLASLLVIALAVGGYFLWRELHPDKMTGDFRVAVADFAVIGNSGQTDSGTELAQGVYQKLNESLSKINKDFTVTTWSPDKVGKVEGNASEERAKSAEKIAQKIGADVLVYGLIDMSQPVWKITPEFYVVSDNFYEAEEITGHYQIGKTFDLEGQDSITRRIALSKEYEIRAQVISRITIGLAYFSLRNYETALTMFQSAQDISSSSDTQEEKVLYLLAGNAAMKSSEFDTAISKLNKSLAIDSEYARPLITLGSVYYLQALQPFAKTGKPADIDLGLLSKSIEQYNRALISDHQPDLSDIPTKVHFGLGQCYLLQSYSGMDKSLNKAVDEFKIVIADYGNGKNPRVRELAAEAHARLGLINDLSGYSRDAAQEYQLAADLLFDDPERQNLYKKRAEELLANHSIVTATP